MKEKFIMTILAENRHGLVATISGMLSRRKLEMESFTATKTDIKSVIQITVETFLVAEEANRLIRKIENIIEVYKAEITKESDAVSHRAAIFKVSKDILNSSKSSFLHSSQMQILNICADTITLSQTGPDALIRQTYNYLDGPHLIGFQQSGLLSDLFLLIDDDDAHVGGLSLLNSQLAA